MDVLDKSNKCIVGGRVGDVGVGGYLMQGGISYLTAQYATRSIPIFSADWKLTIVTQGLCVRQCYRIRVRDSQWNHHECHQRV